MSGNSPNANRMCPIDEELYFLMLRFLEAGPCKRAFEVLKAETDSLQLLPKRWDWQGKEHHRPYEDLVSLYRHVAKDHMKQICLRLGPLLDEKLGRRGIPCARSLLGAGSHSLLRTEQTGRKAWGSNVYAARRHGASPLLAHDVSVSPGLLQAVAARQVSGVACGGSRAFPPPSLYRQLTVQARVLGHLSAAYCVGFDRSGKYVFTGADDNLVKVWSSRSGRLLATLRGHSGEIADMAVSFDNSLLASGSCDHTVRVWCLQTTATIAVLRGHTSSITSLQFCPMNRGSVRYLLSTGGDGTVCFWRYVVNSSRRPTFDDKPLKFVERSRAGAQMLCSSFSPGGLFLATGSTDHVVRMYSLHGPSPSKVAELEAHSDMVDSIQYSNYGARFVSGSKDGTARIWRRSSANHWVHIVLPVATKLPSASEPATSQALALNSSGKDSKTAASKLKVTMVCWSLDDNHVMTAVSDYSVKVWDSRSGQLLKVLKGHEDEVYVIEHSPVHPWIVLSAGHDGKIILWDISKGQNVRVFFNEIQGQGYGAVYDCKFAPDGQSFAATDSHGHLLHCGFTRNEQLERLPTEMFFHTDYRPLTRDANDYVLDEQTQQPPHLMPPPFLVNIDGVPLAPHYQRLVPGRERCSHAQLVPQMGETPSGDREVLDQPVVPEPAIIVDQDGGAAAVDQLGARIAELQREHDRLQGGPADGADGPLLSPSGIALAAAGLHRRDRMPSLSSPRIRRNNEVEGVRQAVGNVPRSHRATESELSANRLKVVVEPLDAHVVDWIEAERNAFTEQETLEYLADARQNLLIKSEEQGNRMSANTRQKRLCSIPKVNHGYRTRAARQQQRENEVSGRNRLAARALYDTEDEDGISEEVAEDNEVDRDIVAAEPSSSDEDQWGGDKSSSESSEYSDWAADGQSNLQPPTRTSKRQTRRRQLSSSSSEDEKPEDVRAEECSFDAGSSVSGVSRGKRKAATRSAGRKAKKRASRPGSGSTELRSTEGSPQELPEAFRLPDWLTNTLPRRSPYFPQMGDEVMYFRQGHELYLDAVCRTRAYEVNPERNQPWHKNPQLREQELMKVVGIKYDVRPPRLCCVKLAYMDPVTRRLTGGAVTVKYHDMPDVIDFIVLKQLYDQAVARDWKAGDRFRAVIDDQWWIGVIKSHEPFDPDLPDSFYQCFIVEWENKETERMSPWDLEPLVQRRTAQSNGVPLTSAELQHLQYVPAESEWPSAGRDEECQRIAHCIERIMEYSVAEPFIAPVDFSAFPVYAMTIGYPIDLSTIKARLDNRFYRRVSAIQFDVRHVESNATEFNEPNAPIVRAAKLVVELIMKIVGDETVTDPHAIYAQLVANPRYSGCLGTRAVPGTAQDMSMPSEPASPERSREEDHQSTPDAWKALCERLLDVVFECDDSVPFRQPVDPLEYPDYAGIIDCPTDFGTIREQLSCGVYSSPIEFYKDVKQVFINSKAYNTNKRSKIYAMTLRLQPMVDQRMSAIVAGWRSAVSALESRRSTRNRNRQQSSQLISNRVTRVAAGLLTTGADKSRTGTDVHHPSGNCINSSVACVNGDGNDEANSTQSRTGSNIQREQRVRPISNSSADGIPGAESRSPFKRKSDRHIVAEAAPTSRTVTSHDSGTCGSGLLHLTRARTGSLKPRTFSSDENQSAGDKSESEVAPPRQPVKITLHIRKHASNFDSAGTVVAAPQTQSRQVAGATSDTGMSAVASVPAVASATSAAAGHNSSLRRLPQRSCRTAASSAVDQHCQQSSSSPAGSDSNCGSSDSSGSSSDSDTSYEEESPVVQQLGMRGKAMSRPKRVRSAKTAAVASFNDESSDFLHDTSSEGERDTVENNGRRSNEHSPSQASDNDLSDEDLVPKRRRLAQSSRRAQAKVAPVQTRHSSRPCALRKRRKAATSDSDQSSPIGKPRKRRRLKMGSQGAGVSDDDAADTTSEGSWKSGLHDSSPTEATLTPPNDSRNLRARRVTFPIPPQSPAVAHRVGQRRTRPVNYSEVYNETSATDDDDDGERQFSESVVMTVSSRGRVRKLTSRARESFLM